MSSEEKEPTSAKIYAKQKTKGQAEQQRRIQEQMRREHEALRPPEERRRLANARTKLTVMAAIAARCGVA